MRIALLFFFFSSFLSAQEYPKDYFKSPLDIPLFLSGNFGELRKNHFHTGLDFRTQQKEGFNVYAAADGYVSRIKISTFGYGKAIYITHPNGFTTVYGHLQKAVSQIEVYIKENHYLQQSYEMDLKLEPNQLIVKQGDLIGISGNTGGSGGPHLHFEVRDTQTEEIINPLNFGFNTLITDTKFPVISSMIVFPLDDNSSANGSQLPQIVNLSLQKDGSYLADKIAASGKISFGICAYDYFNGTTDTNGLYKVQSYLNGTPSFSYQLDRFTFDQARYVNALLDYSRYIKTGVRYQKLFMLNPYPFEAISSSENHGIIEMLPNLASTYRIEMSDFNGNKITVNVPLVYSNTTPKVLKKEQKTNYFLKANQDNIYKKNNISVFVPANTFYDDFYLKFDVKDDTLFLHDDSVAVQNDFSITIEDTTSIENEREKMFIASIDGKKLSYNATKRIGNNWVTYTKNLGQFVLAKDLVTPSIKPFNFQEGQWLSLQPNLQFTINDDFSGIKTYNGYLNGKWVLFEYDFKTKKITHFFENDFLLDGRNDLCMSVADNVGNTVIFETYFFCKKQ